MALSESDKEKYTLVTTDKIRYCDADSQGHVNNAVFSTFLETGRTEMLAHENLNLLNETSGFALANLNMDFLQPVFWPGEVQIYTGLSRIGGSSLELQQIIVQNDQVAASAKTTLVQIDLASNKSKKFTNAIREELTKYLIQPA